MADVHLYFAVENINLNDTQRDTLVDAIRRWGRDEGNPQPSHRMHWRVRLDNQAVIFHSVIDDSNLTMLSVRQRLAALFGVAVAQIIGTVNTPDFGLGTTQVVTFSRLGINYLRIAVFGGISATTEQSRQEALTYLALHQAEWENGNGGGGGK